MNQRILVTGGSGLLGSYLVRRFRQLGYIHITATYHHSPDAIPSDIREGIQWLPLSLPDKLASDELAEGKDWVIHTAGFVSYHPGDKYKMLEIHKTGTEHLVNACLHHQVSHFIYISSISTLGRESPQATLNESSAWVENEFSTSYGLSKYLGELESWRAAAEGLKVTAILPSVILGTGDWERSSLQMIRRIVSGPGYYPGGQTGFVDVRDVVAFIQLVLEKSLSGDRWLINGTNISYADVYRLVADYMDLKRSYSPAPKWLANMLLRSGNLLKKNSLGIEILRHTYGMYSYDAAKSLSVEGFQYRPLEKSLEEIASEYKRGGHGFPLPF